MLKKQDYIAEACRWEENGNQAWHKGSYLYARFCYHFATELRRKANTQEHLLGLEPETACSK